MATSGTYDFAMDRDSLIKAALRLTGRFSPQDVIPPEDMNDVAQALQILCKAMVIDGLPLWCVETEPVTLIPGQAEYDLSALTGMPLPPRILDCYLRDPTGNDVTIEIVSRYDYDTLGQKLSPGIPNQIYYDPQLNAGKIITYNVMDRPDYTLMVVYQRQIQDINLATENPDFPQEAYRMLKWNLADEIALDYQTPPDIRSEIGAKAFKYKEDFFAFEQEAASVYFTPSERSGNQG